MNQCGVSNFLAAVVSIAKRALVVAAGCLAVVGVFLLFISAVLFVMHKPNGFRTDTQGWVLYALCAASALGFLAYGLWWNWRKTIREGAIALAKLAMIFCAAWYVGWVGTVAPTALDHPLTLFVGSHQPLWVHFALVPAQASMVVVSLGIAGAVCLVVWHTLRSMCTYGAELQEAKAKKRATTNAA